MTMTQVDHTIHIDAPPETVSRIISDVSSWPVYFPPTVHAERVSGDDLNEQIQIWAMANGELRTWYSHRSLSADKRRIDFEQLQPRHPVSAMGGTWHLEDEDGGCLVTLTHHYEAVGDDADALALMNRAVDTNSTAELAALKRSAEREENDLVFAFEDTQLIDGNLSEAYDFIYDCGSWPERLSHVARLDVTEAPGGLQVMEMDTRSPDGSVHTTRSGRVCLDQDRIVYKQTEPPRGLNAHSGRWLFRDGPGGQTEVTSRHVVILDPEAIASLPNPPASLTEARAAVRHALGSNSRATLQRAKEHIEGRNDPVLLDSTMTTKAV